MAAMHWEARRRQSALERREAHKQQLLQEDRAPAGPHPEAEAGPSVSAEEQCPHCKSTLTTTVTGKVPNRYSLLQEDRAPAGPHPEAEAGPSVSAEEQCPHCKSTLTTTVTGKVPNRYSSLQYKQQW